MPDNKSDLSKVKPVITPSNFHPRNDSPVVDQSSNGNSVTVVPSLSQMQKDNDNNLPSSTSNQANNLPEEGLFSFVKRRWAIILGIACGISTAVGWWTFQQSPIYQGKFMMLVEKQIPVDK